MFEAQYNSALGIIAGFFSLPSAGFLLLQEVPFSCKRLVEHD